MAKLAAFYSRADENYFSGGYRYVTVGNTEKVAKVISELTGADLFKIEQKIPYAANFNCLLLQIPAGLEGRKAHTLLYLQLVPHTGCHSARYIMEESG